MFQKLLKVWENIFKKKRPDYIFLIGDRAEVHSAAIASLHFNIPIIHLYGGDLTQGGTDEPTRHAQQKFQTFILSMLTRDSYRNVIKMGEEKMEGPQCWTFIFRFISEKYFKSKNYLEKNSI